MGLTVPAVLLEQEAHAFRVLQQRALRSRRSGDRWVVLAIEGVRAERSGQPPTGPELPAMPHRSRFSFATYKAACVLLRLLPPEHRTTPHQALLRALTAPVAAPLTSTEETP